MCARPVPVSHVCSQQGRTELASLVTVGFYHDPRLRALIHRLKYDSSTCLLPSIAQLLSRWKHERLQTWPWAGTSSIHLQPVPATPERIRARGFDQAELITDMVQEQLIPWGVRGPNLLQRSSSLQAQVDVESGPLRQANVQGAFSVDASQAIPETILLIDDVYTTGATMKEAAKVLSAAGATSIYGFALALGA